MALVAHVFDSLPAWTGAAPTSPGFSSLDVLLGGRFVIAAILSLVIVNVLLALIVTVLFLMLSVLLRREWIAAVVIVLLLGVQQALQMSLPIWMTLPFGLIIWALPVLDLPAFRLAAPREWHLRRHGVGELPADTESGRLVRDADMAADWDSPGPRLLRLQDGAGWTVGVREPAGGVIRSTKNSHGR